MEIIRLLILIVILVGMSAICSGLNLALMSLDLSDLKRKAKLGNKKAQNVLPLRTNSHLSLVSILFSNVAVISTTSLVLEHRFSGLIAGIASTLLIVIFGEIFPQALFVRRPLDFTNRLAPVLKVMIIVTYPLSKPLQLILDKLFAHQPNRLHSRKELGLLIAEHANHNQSELDDSEVDIIQGALMLSDKKVASIMTPIKKAYWLCDDCIIDADKIDEIKEKMYSRIPVFNKALTKCQGLLLMKDLVDIDFDEQSYNVQDFNLHPTRPIGQKTALDTIFRKFISARTHLMPVTHERKIVGIVTIEDVVEEIIGQEIEDERDSSSH